MIAKLKTLLAAGVVLAAALIAPAQAHAAGTPLWCGEYQGIEVDASGWRVTNTRIQLNVWTHLSGWMYLYISGWDTNHDGVLDPFTSAYASSTWADDYAQRWYVDNISQYHTYRAVVVADNPPRPYGSSLGYGNHCSSPSFGIEAWAG